MGHQELCRRRSARPEARLQMRRVYPHKRRGAGLVLSACPFDLLENQAQAWGAVSRQSRAPWLDESGPVLARGIHAPRARPFFKPAAASGSWLQCAPWEDPALPHLDPDPITSAPGPTPHLDPDPPPDPPPHLHPDPLHTWVSANVNHDGGPACRREKTVWAGVAASRDAEAGTRIMVQRRGGTPWTPWRGGSGGSDALAAGV